MPNGDKQLNLAVQGVTGKSVHFFRVCLYVLNPQLQDLYVQDLLCCDSPVNLKGMKVFLYRKSQYVPSRRMARNPFTGFIHHSAA